MVKDIVPKRDVPTHILDDYDEDLELVRKTLRSLLISGEEGIELANRVAEESEHPRAIEVLGGLLKQQAENAGKLLAMHKTHKEINTNEASSDRPNVTNNNLYVTDTSEFLKELEAEDKESDSESPIIIDADVTEDDE